MVRSGAALWRLRCAVACLSAALLGFEIVLLRLLQLASWHHFAFVVISMALMGFGASGTILCLFRPWLLARSSAALWVLILTSVVSMPLVWQTVQAIPIESRLIPVLLWEQAGQWLLYWLVLSLPFVLGASALGLALMISGRDVPSVYGANLVGSGVGAGLATLAMSYVQPAWLPTVVAALVLPAVWCAAPGQGQARRWAGAVGAALVLALLLLVTWQGSPQIRIDEAKYARYARDLVEQGDARLVATAISPRGMLEVYAGSAFHDLPFLGPGQAPPPLAVMLQDGHLSGSLLDIDQVAEASALGQTLMAVAYDVVGPEPRVLLLGERGGSNIWLALSRAAQSIDVVQPDANVFQLLRGPLHEHGGAVLDYPSVNTITDDPRHFVQHGRSDTYDLIQLTTLESSAAGSGGIGGLAQDHLVTVEGFAACLDRLTPSGVLFVCRGIQTPPRDNIKLLATIVAALDRLGFQQPQRHVAIVRDFQALCTMVRRSPWTPDQVQNLRRICEQRQLTPVWFDGVRDEELNQPDHLPGPEGAPGDWYYHAATELFSDAAAQFIDDWAFDIRPPTDDRPFFADFCRLRTLGKLRAAFGALWLTRIEIALPFVLVTLAVATVVGALLTWVLLLLVRSVRAQPGKWPTSTYFASIGLAYLMLEMTVLARLTHLIGDPVHAAALTIGTFLILSGLASLMVAKVQRHRTAVLRCAVLALVVVAVAAQVLWPLLLDWASGMTAPGRMALAVGMIAPAALLMGVPMAIALARLERAAAPLLPWAWGVNGFASVIAAPLATVIGMTVGFRIAGAVALMLYLVAAAVYGRLPQPVANSA